MGVDASPGPSPLGGGGGSSPDPPGRTPAPALAAVDGRTAAGGGQSHEQTRSFGLRTMIPPWKPRAHSRWLAHSYMVSRADTDHHLGSHSQVVATRRGSTRHCFSYRPIMGRDTTRWQTGTCQHSWSPQADARGNASTCSPPRGQDRLTSTRSPPRTPITCPTPSLKKRSGRCRI